MPATIFSPAKINLFLAVTGRRADGFHELVSLVSPLTFGDTLHGDWAGDGEGHSLGCDQPDVPLDASNLILKAARLFDAALPCVAPTAVRGVRFTLEKRIPMGAGLGGGSSNAVAALRVLNALHGHPLAEEALEPLAAQLGSDCPLFLRGGPVVMRGRGERVETLAPSLAARLSGQRLLVFKPAFGVSTPWAYRRMVEMEAAEAGCAYLPAAEAERHLTAWLSTGGEGGDVGGLLRNNMERAVFSKYLALPVLQEHLRNRFGLSARMSGSGSACFALLEPDAPPARVTEILGVIREAWGARVFSTETTLI